MLCHNCQSNSEMTVDLLAKRKRLNEVLGLFVYAKNAINVIWRLTLRHVLTELLKLIIFENIAFVLNNT